MTRKPRTVAFWSGRLPHWEVESGRYFVTVHLAGAIPRHGRVRLRRAAEEVKRMRDPRSPEWLCRQRRIFAEMEHWLDQARWNPHLGRGDIAQMVAEAIDHRHSRGDCQVFEYVVMPTHVHMFCEMGIRGLKAIMQDFKHWTGHRAAELLGTQGTRFWQREWFDHWSRSDEEDDRIVAYIRNNPVKAGLVEDYRTWLYASWSRR